MRQDNSILIFLFKSALFHKIADIGYIKKKKTRVCVLIFRNCDM